MRDALRLLAQALDPGQSPEAAAGALEALRDRWPALDAEEREALTPVAQLAARRLQAPSAAAEADPDGAAYVAALGAMAGSAPADEDPGLGAAEPEPDGVVALPPPRAPRTAIDADPEALLTEFGLTAFRPGQREAVAAALAGRD